MSVRSNLGIILTSVAALSLTACTGPHKWRVASVGSTAQGEEQGEGPKGDQNGGGTGNGGTGNGGSGGSGGSGGNSYNNLIIASGNVLIGAAAKFGNLSGTVNGTVPAAGVVSGKVVAVLNTSGHTLVKLGNGTNVLLDGTGGKLGSLVSIDFGKGRVIGGTTPLIGVNVLAANPRTGSLATVSAASGAKLVGVTVLNPGVNSGGPVLAPSVAPLLGLTSGSTKVSTSVNTVIKGVITAK